MRGIAAVAGLGVAGGIGLWRAPRPAFTADDGETNETVVELLLTADPITDDIVSVERSTTSTVIVHDLEASVGIDATAETRIESDEAVEG